jgi:outer membrane protein OmpA-like peptidoglycan-associated protein
MFRVALALALAVALWPAVARADEPLEIGGFLGPRLFGAHQLEVGYNDDQMYHPTLANTVELGARIAHQFWIPWFYPEAELVFAPTKSNELMGASATVMWIEPRAQLRIDIAPRRRIDPFVVVGTGAPIAISSARKTFNSGITAEGFLGVGVRYDTGRMLIRLDARMAALPGVDPVSGDNRLAFAGDISLGIDFPTGRRAPVGTPEPGSPEADRDNDGIPDSKDQCPDRPEDKDGFQDADGCPDIDNDGDHVLDVADKCPTEQETWNGYQDEDGCPDTVPADVDAIRGTVEGLIYGEAESAVRDSAQPTIAKIVKVMQDHPSITIVLVGHTDNQEAKSLASPPEKGQPPPDLTALAVDLSKGRAEAFRQALVAAGVPSGRIQIGGVGDDEPVADNATAKGRLANRRVELKLFVNKP